MHEQNIICSKTQNTYLEAVIRRSSGGLSANENEGKKYIEWQVSFIGLLLLCQGIEGSTAIGVTQVVTTSVGMTDIDIRAVSKIIAKTLRNK